MDPGTVFKILIIGESGVGKTSLVKSFIGDTFDDHQNMTIGVDFKAQEVIVDGISIKLNIWDTAGEERYRSLTPTYYRNGQGAIIVYDVSNRPSFEKMWFWLNELDTYSTKSKIVKMIVGNKIDLENRAVSRQEGLEFAKQYSALYVESSAKTRDGVECAFDELVRKIYETPGLWEQVTATQGGSFPERATSSCAGWSCFS